MHDTAQSSVHFPVHWCFTFKRILASTFHHSIQPLFNKNYLQFQTQRCPAIEEDDFKPTPIPLNDWRHDKRGGRAGTLHDIIKTDASPTVAVLPAHYWEDALRHSVYLTLVRDKIDQLIAKGLVVSPDSSHEQHYSTEVDDHDLWEKIKSAPFDRLREQELSSTSDVQIMAKGRLLEENGGFRFSEDDTSSNKCEDDTCSEGVKAFWSVKRVRQRDDETSPGKYHYELTFSVTSQVPKKKRNSYENTIRTFTVRETEPQRSHWTNKPYHSPRPQRAIWFHKNINVPQQHYSRHPHNQNLDRIFSSLFMDDDFFDDPPPRYKMNPYPTHIFSPHPKIGFLNPQSQFTHQKKLLPYPYKPYTYKFSRPLPSPPLQNMEHPPSHFLQIELPIKPHTFSHTDQGYMSSNTVKTTRPAFLPTPATIPFTRNEILNTEDKHLNVTETFKSQEIEKESDEKFAFNQNARPTAVKVNYFAEHVRPPVFNTPPGVFVTMDKKPFKPMPPLKFIPPAKVGKSKPIDFRPSLQVLEAQFSDLSPDTEFRPIAMGYHDNKTTATNNDVKDKIENKKRLLANNEKKSNKFNSVTTTTYVPDIITASDESVDNTELMEYTNIIGAITRTTPMASQGEKTNNLENVTSIPTTPMLSTSTILISSTTTDSTTTTVMTTTKQIPVPSSSLKPKKRTRPPPKFKGSDKFKKHKRVSSTTPKMNTINEPSSTTQLDDLSLQSTSGTVSKSLKIFKKNTTLTTPITKEPLRTTTSFKPPTITTTTEATQSKTHTTTTEKEQTIATTQPKNKNRFRQSTLMHKGTSVKHDRWSTTVSEKNRTVPLSKQFPPRRKGSNFQGYVSTTAKKENNQRNEKDNLDHATSITTIVNSTIEISTENKVASVSAATRPTYDDTMDQYDFGNEASDFVHTNEDQKGVSNKDESNEQESKDKTEYIFTTNTSPSERTVEGDQEITLSTTEGIILSSPLSVKKKCKRKKIQTVNSTTEAATQTGLSDISTLRVTPTTMTTSTTEKAVTPDIIDELLGAFTFDESSNTAKDVHTTAKTELDVAASENVERYINSDEHFEDFLGSFNSKENENDVNESEEYDDDIRENPDEEESSVFSEDDTRHSRDTNDYTDYQERPYSLLELIDME